MKGVRTNLVVTFTRQTSLFQLFLCQPTSFFAGSARHVSRVSAERERGFPPRGTERDTGESLYSIEGCACYRGCCWSRVRESWSETVKREPKSERRVSSDSRCNLGSSRNRKRIAQQQLISLSTNRVYTREKRLFQYPIPRNRGSSENWM